ncbi:BadF/BadG/BcrA/BcrD ATPase family protein [Thermoanaerobacter thermohydrosulfuricus]
MKYVIGIDGGGTKSIISVADLQGNIIVTEEGGSTNIRSQKESEVYTNLGNLIENALKKADLRIEECEAICIGTAGAGREEEQDKIKKYIQSLGVKGKILITNDAEIVIAEATGGKEGIAVIAGTGSIAYGIGKNGERVRVGGWGHLIGDEGSAYYIGIEGIRAALRCHDGREPYTELLPMIMREINIINPEEFVNFVYEENVKKDKIASLARIVDQACKKGDKKAKEILTKAAKELFLLAKAVIKKLKVEEENMTVVVSGSVFLNNVFVYEEFAKLLTKEYPNVSIKKSRNRASKGAVMLALKLLVKG